MKLTIQSIAAAYAVSSVLACSASPGEGETEPESAQSEEEAPTLAELRAQRDAEEHAQNNIVSIGVEEGHTVNFVVTDAAGVVLYERWLAGQESVLDDIEDTSITGIFDALRPGEEVPAELLEQESGSNLLDAPPAEDTVAVPEVEPAPAELALLEKHLTNDGAHFRAHNQCPTVMDRVNFGGEERNTVSDVCWLEVMGPGNTASISATHSAAYIGATIGNTGITTVVGGQVVNSFTVLEGEQVRQSLRSAVNSDFKVRQQGHQYFINGGAGFHFGAGWIRNSGARRFFYKGKNAF